MKIQFVAGFGPIIRDAEAAHAFWRDGLGIEFEEPAPGYFTNDTLDGVKAFAMWPLSQAAEATFGSPDWPADIPEPQAWLELDVESAEAVAPAIEELRAAGHRVLTDAHEEPWGQTTARALSPEGLLVGIAYTPWMHREPTGPIRSPEPMTATRVQIVFDCADPAAQADFWSEALNYVVPPPPEPHASWDDWARSMGIPEERWNDARALEDADEVGPRLFFQKVPEPKVAKNRMHLDLNIGGGPSVPLVERKRRVMAEVERLKALGATDERGAMEKDGEYWVRMNDPEGNEFCVQ